MFQINIEKKLLKEKKEFIPKELLIIKEYDKLGEIVDNNVLEKTGLNKTLLEGKKITESIARKTKELEKFNKTKVFHISQLESICKKYYLRMLPSNKFKGSIDKVLPIKMEQFEIAYNVELNKKNCFIIAPPNSFYLTEKPRDPLFFYQINEDYFYLIYKWGNDLSIFNRILGLFSSVYFLLTLTAFFAIIPITLFFLGQIAMGAICLAITIISFVNILVNDDLHDSDKWRKDII